MAPLNCLFCDQSNPATAKFCNECGTPLHFKPCPQCDGINGRFAESCYRCGAAFSPLAHDGEPATLSPLPDAPGHAASVGGDAAGPTRRGDDPTALDGPADALADATLARHAQLPRAGLIVALGALSTVLAVAAWHTDEAPAESAAAPVAVAGGAAVAARPDAPAPVQTPTVLPTEDVYQPLTLDPRAPGAPAASPDGATPEEAGADIAAAPVELAMRPRVPPASSAPTASRPRRSPPSGPPAEQPPVSETEAPTSERPVMAVALETATSSSRTPSVPVAASSRRTTSEPARRARPVVFGTPGSPPCAETVATLEPCDLRTLPKGN